MKTIVFCTPQFFPDKGGVERHVFEVSKALKNDKLDIIVITQQTNLSQKYFEVVDGISVYRIPKNAISKIKIWSWIWKNKKILTSATIVHAHDVGWWLLPLLPFIHAKLFITFHGWEGEFPVPVLHKIHRFLLASVAVGTVHVGKYIQTFYWDMPTAVMYGGVNTKKITPVSFDPTKNTIVFVGRLEKENDVLLYIDLFKKLQSRHTNLSILWVGDGQYRPICEKYGRVTGMVSNPSDYYADALLVCAASYLSILEALQMGKLIVAVYNSPLKKQYIELFPFASQMICGSDISKIISKIEMALTDPEKITTQLKIVQAEVNEIYTWRTVADTYLQLWKLKPPLQ
jgi:glycosyltransferase involved in cell wall biosynthesis